MKYVFNYQKKSYGSLEIEAATEEEAYENFWELCENGSLTYEDDDFDLYNVYDAAEEEIRKMEMNMHCGLSVNDF